MTPTPEQAQAAMAQFKRAIVYAKNNSTPSFRCSVPLSQDSAATLLALLEASARALGRSETYLRDLEDNLDRNNADMMLDECEDPNDVADEMAAVRALIAPKGEG